MVIIILKQFIYYNYNNLISNYIPGIPYFTLEFYKGTARRIQYMLNNTDPDGHQPPPCFVDWPEGTFSGETKWTLGHCQNLVMI